MAQLVKIKINQRVSMPSKMVSITDLGSGMNYKKKGLTKLIGLIISSKVDKIFVTYRDWRRRHSVLKRAIAYGVAYLFRWRLA